MLEDREHLDHTGLALILLGIGFVLVGGYVFADLSGSFIAAALLAIGLLAIQWGFNRWDQNRQQAKLRTMLESLRSKGGCAGGTTEADEGGNGQEQKCHHPEAG